MIAAATKAPRNCASEYGPTLRQGKPLVCPSDQISSPSYGPDVAEAVKAGESPIVLLIWAYDTAPMEPRFPVEFDPHYAEIAIRGMSRMVPAMAG